MAKEVKIPITGNSSDYKKALAEADQASGKFAKSTEGHGKQIAAAGAIAATAIGAFAADAIGAASDYNETVSKSKVIFGDASDSVTKFAETAAESLGLSQQAALDAEATFATFGKGAGLAGTDLAGFAQNLTGLAADMASFSNTSPEQAIEAIGAALRGEAEPIRAYGVLLDDATLKAAAMKLGIYDGTGALTQQQKVLAAQKAIMEQTTDAQGDFARTSGGLAGQQKILAAQFENTKVALGTKLIPVALEAVTTFNQLAFGSDAAADSFSQFTKDLQVKPVADVVNEFLALAVETGNARSGFDKLQHGVGEFFHELNPLADGGGEKLRNLQKAFGDLGERSPESMQPVIEALSALTIAADGGDETAQKLVESYGLTDDVLIDLYKSIPKVTEATAEQTAAQGAANAVQVQGKQSTDDLKKATEQAAEKSKALADALKDQQDRLNELYGIQRSAVDAKWAFAESSAQALTDTDALNKAVGSSKTTQEELTAATNTAKDSILQASEDYATLTGAALDSEGGIRRQIDSLKLQQQSLDPSSPLRQFLREYIADLESIPSNISTALALNISSGSVTTKAGDVIGVRAGPHAAGGRIPRHEGLSLVGEQGPELISAPGANVYNASDTAAMMGGGGQVTVNIYPPVGTSPDDIVRSLAKHVGRNGPGALQKLSGVGLGINGGTP